MTKVLFVAAEAVPFAKTGGLGDVIGSLPKELRQKGLDVRVILPKYQDIPASFQEQMTLKAEFTVPVGWRQQYCGIYMLEYQGITFYFVDNEYYFKRHGFYGYGDDAERFAFFSRAVLEGLDKIDFMPEVLHCHDWHAAVVPVLLKANYAERPEYQGVKTVFTVHNLRYQGVFPQVVMADILGLEWQYFQPDGLEFFDAVNYMKGGLAYADRITTVSRTYAQEIQDPFYGEQLDGLLRKRREDLSGITNGIDYDDYNPAVDKALFVNYDASCIEKRRENKSKLQQQLKLPVKDVPLIAVVSRLVGPKGMDLVEYALNDMVKHLRQTGQEKYGVQFVVVGTGEARYENFFKYLAWQFPGKLSANIIFDDRLARQVYAGADLFLMPSLYEPCGIGQLIAMRYGCLPIVRETGGLKDTVTPYNSHTGEGTGFSFANYNAHELMETMERALELYEDRPTWEKIIKNAMQRNFSWQESARQYQEVYAEIAGKK
ncbi:glycogen synthase GlgA [Azotosporobacter soli]|uniref:glycogen synthase GlgA n=1 Tax=Azotosporobacter soli TaxID=3055040 RepID=UPI0031FF4194